MDDDFIDYCYSLTELDLSFNRIHSPLPKLVGTTHLVKLDLSYNRFYGTIPMSWRALVSVTLMSVSNNAITSPFAAVVVSMTALKRLDMYVSITRLVHRFKRSNRAQPQYTGAVVWWGGNGGCHQVKQSAHDNRRHVEQRPACYSLPPPLPPICDLSLIGIVWYRRMDLHQASSQLHSHPRSLLLRFHTTISRVRLVLCTILPSFTSCAFVVVRRMGERQLL